MAKNSMSWFKIGNEPGLRSLKEQIRGLDKLQPFISRSTILDLGAAEGMIGKWMVDGYGADHVDCIESVPERVATGRSVCSGYDNMRFFVGDLNEPQKVDGLLQLYDIVLCLAILHKLKDPAGALKWAASKAYKFIVVRMPTKSRTFEDPRSDGVVFSPVLVVEKDWALIADDLGPRDELTMIFKRKGL